ncbi:MAG: hypothetical protein US83_C0001G0074 [Candidatus Falkowbacteria bacterium GW2011_GWC2_38_22]|uniref:Uncharacterized protein n=1 Tax=Candidatus Falkowbacteria bacterium GW2011_GWE1_38_31 TaxID=1618638 RepID=A0A0G0K684_9BACT|nr:MAG: hypothetical protein US73_C0004G0054 [Candidatus Falkowbacteria bacterium GW2011_GWF2_38_1205]KKQ62140.1 MAG: hypothetical protein US83_C0001G0074 [Candidatus Falkowbacteria bacterium GW2011_GWC2_38_22]KKQ64290.1 MAG: hypothetical protein US84_C0001G0074 [Candidatus Falkowbacteria bacterium GW2011_GWF1_38_22]KKQ66267.1 MAG: hypothetical protein US87_C0002G0074 [Candidatus Falkowbacteria bacterium GW2011_GWE2_38_254]KKQ70995.1 MAG: hypothetical protein US91_C0002G0074 [Candidatus Falkowb
MDNNDSFKKIGDLFSTKIIKKAPAYQWQELALRIIKDLNIPDTKKSSVFKACRENPKNFVEQCLNDTKELCKTGEKWKYFFKIINQPKV